MAFKVPEKRRILHGRAKSSPSHGNNGCFIVIHKAGRHSRFLNVVASDGAGWEHVSVSMPDKCPTWDQMCFIKNMFWSEDDAVIQIHPPSKKYVNHHPYCLHLWRRFNTNDFFDMPEPIFVGPLE